jgi:hypothetical protein
MDRRERLTPATVTLLIHREAAIVHEMLTGRELNRSRRLRCRPDLQQWTCIESKPTLSWDMVVRVM